MKIELECHRALQKQRKRNSNTNLPSFQPLHPTSRELRVLPKIRLHAIDLEEMLDDYKKDAVRIDSLSLTGISYDTLVLYATR